MGMYIWKRSDVISIYYMSIIVDGTQTYSGDRRINEGCLERHYDKGTENEHVNYRLDVLEEKIYLLKILKKRERIASRLECIKLNFKNKT